jgi:hypothetical protein
MLIHNCFKGTNLELNDHRFSDLEEITVSPQRLALLDSITFEIFGDGLCMSPISNSKLSRPLWTTLHPMFANDEFILAKTNSVCIAQA